MPPTFMHSQCSIQCNNLHQVMGFCNLFGVFGEFFPEFQLKNDCCVRLLLIRNCFRWSTDWNEEVNIAHLWEYAFYWIPCVCERMPYLSNNDVDCQISLVCSLESFTLAFCRRKWNVMYAMQSNNANSHSIAWREAKRAQRSGKRKKHEESQKLNQNEHNSNQQQQFECIYAESGAWMPQSYLHTFQQSSTQHRKVRMKVKKKNELKCSLWLRRECEHRVSNIVDKVHFG